MKNENGQLVRAGLWGRKCVLKEGISQLTGGSHSIDGRFYVETRTGNVPGPFKELEDDQCD